MDLLTIESTFIPHLRGQFANGSPVLFLGAGFSLGAMNRSGRPVPSAADLSKELWSLCFGSEPFDSSTQLQDIFETALSRKPKELHEMLRGSFTVNADSCTTWHSDLLRMPWLRIYTLNIDDLAFKVLSEHSESRQVRAVSAMRTTSPIFDDTKLSIIHLNGMVEDGPQYLTFSRSQYAQRRGVDPAYVQLLNDLLFRSVVFIGTAMEEGPLWDHLEMRGNRPSRDQHELRPRSYLVIPNLNKSKEALLSRFNIAWLQMSAERFNASMLSQLTKERISGHLALKELGTSTLGSRGRFDKVADLASNDKVTEEYLLGAEPTWADITSRRVATRDCFDELWNLITTLRAAPTRKQLVVLTGTAGTGKSSALMVTALRLEAEGIHVAWLDADSVFSRQDFRQALSLEDELGALFINDADIYDARLSSIVRDAIEHDTRTIVVCEARSAKVDRIINRHELGDTEVIEYTIPSLGNNDIDAILDVLDREHRLGRLKGIDRAARRAVFEGLAGRQLLVAMHMATSGREFEEKVKEELKDLRGVDQFIYGVICVATAHRFVLRKEDVGIACSDEGTAWLQSLDALIRRKLILPHREGSFRARHRVIAQFAYDSLVEDGRLYSIIRALVRIGAAKTTMYSRRESNYVRLLRTFVNHNQMKRGVGIEQARQIYSDFEDALAWDPHFWLHRGALELETNNLDRAENFLNQAKSIDETDIFIDNELAYLAFKKAIERPTDLNSPSLVDSAILMLNEIADRRPDQITHAYHIMGQQGLAWSAVGIPEIDRRKIFLERLLSKVKIAQRLEPGGMMTELHNQIQRAILSLAV